MTTTPDLVAQTAVAVLRAGGDLTAARRWGTSAEELARVEAETAVARLCHSVAKLASAAPPLSPRQIDRVIDVLREAAKQSERISA